MAAHATARLGRKRLPEAVIGPVLNAWRKGASAAAIAAAHSLTRAAVLGIVCRGRQRGDPRAVPRRAPAMRHPARVRDAVLKAWAAGVEIADLVAQSGLRAGQVRSLVFAARRAGDPRAMRRRPGARPPHLVPERAARLEAMVAAWAAGDTLAQISRRHGVSPQRVQQIINAARAAGDPRAVPRRVRGRRSTAPPPRWAQEAAAARVGVSA